MRCAVCLSVVVLLCAAAAEAQLLTGAGSVHGIVRDPYYEGLPGADVVLTNKALRVERLMETSLDGMFLAPSLPPGPGYKLTIQRKGFVSWDSEEFEVRVGETVVFEVMLGEAKAPEGEPGAAWSSFVEDPATGPAVVLNRFQLERLPIREYRLESLAALLPGAAWDARTSDLALRGIPFPGRTLVDGASATRAVPFATGVTPAAVEGVNLTSIGYYAEVGNSMGGVASVATRNAGADYHGAAYGYLLNRSLDALPRFGLGHNLGSSGAIAGLNLGGPLRGEKLLFFVNAEHRNLKSFSLNRITNPLVAGSDGTSVNLSNCAATADQCAAAAALIQSRMNVLVPQSAASNAALAKFDWHPSEWNAFRVSLRERYDRWPEGMRTGYVAPNGGALGQLGMKATTRVVKLGWTAAVGGNGANELSFGAYRTRLYSSGTDTGLATGSLGLSVAGVTLGAADRFKESVRKWRRNEILDQINFVAGAHRLQFGVNWAQSPNWVHELRDGAGRYEYASLTDFALDINGAAKNYLAFTQSLGTPGRRFRTKEIDIYFQDTWRVYAPLTVVYGLRWEKEALPQPQASDSYYYWTRMLPSRNVNFSPRIGVAYKLGERTTARVGAGMFYAPFSMELIDTLTQGHAKFVPSITVARTNATGPRFPNIVAGVGTIPAGSKNLAYAGPKFKNPLTPQVSVSLEHEFPRGLAGSLRYFASPARAMLTTRDMNITETTTSRTYTILDASGKPVSDFTTLVWHGRTSSTLGRVWEVVNWGTSSYHAVVARISKPVTKSFGMDTTYTWSKARGSVGGPWILPGVPLSTYNGVPSRDQGPSNTDQRHRVVSMWTYQTDFAGSRSAALRTLASGWQVAAIATFASALPATATVQTLGQQFTTTATSTNITFPWLSSPNGSGLWDRVGFWDVNSLRLGNEYNVNLRFGRSIPLRKGVTGVIGIEVFNVLNNQFTTGVNTTAYSAVSGVMRPVAGLGTPNAASSPRSAQASLRVEF